MAIVLRTVSINAAFLQEIKDDHHELRQLMHHISAMLERPDWMPIEFDRLTDLFEKLRDQLAMHFSLEEAYGYFEDALAVAPRLSRRADQLRSQHGELYSQLCAMTDRAEQLLYHETTVAAVGQLAADYLAFCQAFHEHERRENDLILEAIDEDLGGGD
ncbi:MAG: hemerythrin domain-containing protein [Pirellulales bacterium]